MCGASALQLHLVGASGQHAGPYAARLLRFFLRHYICLALANRFAFALAQLTCSFFFACKVEVVRLRKPDWLSPSLSTLADPRHGVKREKGRGVRRAALCEAGLRPLPSSLTGLPVFLNRHGWARVRWKGWDANRLILARLLYLMLACRTTPPPLAATCPI